MPRGDDYHTLERTALWIQAQDTLRLHHPYSSPAPPSPTRSSTKTSTTNRSTTSSDAMSLRPPSSNPISVQRSSHLPPMSTRAPSTHTHPRAPSASTQRLVPHSHTRRSSLPFPVSPPGSGYPVAMEVVAPRRPVAEGEDNKASISSSRTGPIDATESPQMLRLPLRKDRRPSLLKQIKQLGTPGHRRRDSEPGKKAA